jgi:hypothetical protein
MRALNVMISLRGGVAALTTAGGPTHPQRMASAEKVVSGG